jgi:5S rRNA maturation endonuclease (ribonuclease M5)
MLSEDIYDFLDYMGIDYRKTWKKVTGACPVHDGDNLGGWNMYTEGDFVKCTWKCRTHLCHTKYKQTIFGFVQGVLERRENRTVPFKEVYRYICNYLGVKPGSIAIDRNKAEKKQFNNLIRSINHKTVQNPTKLTRSEARSRLLIPPEYYLSRGFSKEILDKYDVGLCTNKNKPRMFNRVIVPVYDNDYQYVVGCAGRSIFAECPKCKCYHPPSSQCPQSAYERFLSAKWVNNEGFTSSQYLYNYWFSKNEIRKTGSVLVVEGPGDIFRLEEAGINIGVATFGVNLTEEQLILLESSGALNLIVLTDNDKAGDDARSYYKERCSRLYNLVFPTLPKKDVGETSVEEINKILKPQIGVYI